MYASSASRWPVNVDTLTIALCCAVGLSAAALWPGDAPFINDEPKLIRNAFVCNADGRLAPAGLQGSLGVRYGPVPVWCYQLALFLTHDLVAIVSVRAVLFMALLATALWGLGSTLQMPRSARWVALASPYAWLYARCLWDNTFAIPVGAWALLAYARWRETDSRAWLAVGILSLAVLPLIHLMTLALVLPISAFAWHYGRKQLRHHVLLLAGAAVVVSAMYAYYVMSLTDTDFRQHRWTYAGFIFPLLGFRVVSALGLDYFFDARFAATDPLLWIGVATAIFAGVGCLLGVIEALQRLRRAGGTLAAEIGGLLLAVLFAQILLDGVSASHRHPHYYCGTWVVFPLLLGLGIAARPRWLGWSVPVLVLGLGASTWLLALRLHDRHGTRGRHYGATLANQIEVANRLNADGAAAAVTTDVANVKAFPHALKTLRRLMAATYDESGSHATVTYMSNDLNDGRIGIRRQ